MLRIGNYMKGYCICEPIQWSNKLYKTAVADTSSNLLKHLPYWLLKNFNDASQKIETHDFPD